mgnify:CR=1 FL=1
MSDIFAPDGGWRVRILDLSGGAEDNIVEEIDGFPTLMQANAFARRYVRDSVERCRIAGMSTKDVLETWFAFGEDALVVDAGEAGWRSAAELGESTVAAAVRSSVGIILIVLLTAQWVRLRDRVRRSVRAFMADGRSYTADQIGRAHV